MRLGIVSDTHGLLRPELFPALAGVERILHMGDVGKISVLDGLRQIAPVTAIRGNVDREGPCAELAETDVYLARDRYLYMLHNLDELHLNPEAARFAAVLYGHTHVAGYSTRRGVLYFNPGSCGPKRFRLPATVGLLTVADDGTLAPEIVTLDV